MNTQSHRTHYLLYVALSYTLLYNTHTRTHARTHNHRSYNAYAHNNYNPHSFIILEYHNYKPGKKSSLFKKRKSIKLNGLPVNIR